MLADERRSQVLDAVRRQGFAALPDLASSLGVSESTIRRDLAHLERQGVAQRTHGGAFYTGPSPGLPHFQVQQAAEWDKKRAIAKAASELIGDNDAVLLDGGSTTYELAQLLVGRSLQVVTNSLPVANLFAASDRADLILVGGYVHGRTGVLHGAYAEQMLRSINVRWTVVSGAGVNQRGLFNSNLQVATAEKVMIDVAEEVVAVVDSTKFGHQSLAHVCQLDRIDRIVVDDQLSDKWRQIATNAGVQLTIAELKTHPTNDSNGDEAK